MTIYGLTPALDRLCTHFEGEIVGEGSFDWETRKWGANYVDDMNHWNRFRPSLPSSIPSTPSTPTQDPSLDPRTNNKALYMRWKEQFVIPQSTQLHSDSNTDAQAGPDNIHGASFAGFYYICLDFEPDAEEGMGMPGREGGGMERRRSSAPAAVQRGEGGLLPILSPLVVEESLPTILDSTPATLPVSPSPTPQPLLRHRRCSTGSPHRTRQTYAEIVKSSTSLAPPTSSAFLATPTSQSDQEEPIQARMPLPGNCAEEEFPLPIVVRELRGRRRLRRMLTTPESFAPREDVPETVVLPPPAVDDESDGSTAFSREQGSSDESGRGGSTDESEGSGRTGSTSSDSEESQNTDSGDSIEVDSEDEIEIKSYSNPDDIHDETEGVDYRSRGRSRMDGRCRRFGENKAFAGRGEEVVEELNTWGFDAWSKATVRPTSLPVRSQLTSFPFVDDWVRSLHLR